MSNKLAIIIPAYKAAFFDKTLDSLSRQTDKNFKVYIGDDDSPHDLEKIVSNYHGRLDITYKRFPTNLGNTDLVRHWNRCLDMLQDEDFFCLFSDDDVMEPACIESFHKTLRTDRASDVYHFDIDLIDGNGNIIKSCNNYPSVLSANEFLRMLYTYRIDARMPEFIFRTRHFQESGGFINFDLAYRSDNATVISAARDRGIRTIHGAKILWRDSGTNISSNHNSALKLRRAYATIDFFEWMEEYYSQRAEACPFSLKERLELIIRDILTLADGFPRKELYKALGRVKRARQNIFLYLRCRIYIMIALRKSSKHKKFFTYIKKYCLTPYSKK